MIRPMALPISNITRQSTPLANQSSASFIEVQANGNNNAGDAVNRLNNPQPNVLNNGRGSNARGGPTISRSRRRRRTRIENEIANRIERQRQHYNVINQVDNGTGAAGNAMVGNVVNADNGNDRPVNSFTILEHIGMVGARNFFIPPNPTLSHPCIECYKRAAFYLCMILIISGILFLWNASIHPFHMMGRRFFVAEKYQSMFLTDDDFYPQAAMLIVYLTCIVSGYAVHYTNQPIYDHGFCMYLHSARALIVVGLGFLIWHIWAHAAHYPDSSYPADLEYIMKETMAAAKINIINRGTLMQPIFPKENSVWRDTQTVFKCCGIQGYLDWLPESSPSVSPFSLASNFSKYVPKSCCEKLIADSCEALYVHKSGCLQAQMKVLNTEGLWVINPGLFVAVLAHLALYLILGRLFSNTVAVTRDRRPFEPPPPTQLAEQNANQQNVPAI